MPSTLVYPGPAGSAQTWAPRRPADHRGSVPSLVDVLMSVQGKPGLQYLDYLGRTAPW